MPENTVIPALAFLMEKSRFTLHRLIKEFRRITVENKRRNEWNATACNWRFGAAPRFIGIGV
jgi:hypothetical protein